MATIAFFALLLFFLISISDGKTKTNIITFSQVALFFMFFLVYCVQFDATPAAPPIGLLMFFIGVMLIVFNFPNQQKPETEIFAAQLTTLGSVMLGFSSGMLANYLTRSK